VESGPSGAATKSLSALFRVGTAAGLGDRVLLERFAERRDANDEAAELAFAALVERHGPMVLRVCRAALGDRHESEDAFQATFLVLAGRARSVRRGESLGSWLHGVALRVARRERRRLARRRHRERRYAEMSASSQVEPGRDARPADDDRVLHEEIGRLPEKYRRPVVLCYLEGLTHDQAADQLGWPVGTVRRRLAWARDRLRGRLTRRGAAPSVLPAGLLGPGLVRESTWATISVPTGLAEATVRGALRVGLGKAALAGIVSAEAVALMKGVSQTMTTTKLLTLAAAVLGAGLVTTGVGLMAYPGRQPGEPAAFAQAKGLTPKALEPPGPADADAAGRSPDDQLDALLRQYDDASETLRKTAQRNLKAVPKGATFPAETKARRQASMEKLQAISGQLLDLATRHPRTNAAEQALIWIVSNNAVSPESNRAWELLARDYARSDRLKQVLSRQLVLQWASRSVEDLLRNALEQNPYREIRGLACYWLAELLAYRAEMLRLRPSQPPRLADMWRQRFSPHDLDRVLKQDPKALEHQAAQLYERVIAEFPLVANNDSRTNEPPLVLGRVAVRVQDVAKVHLDELRRLSPGQPAPEIEGVDLDDKPMKLSDFRGKVVVLWITGFGVSSTAPPERAPSHIVGIFRRLARTFEGQPVALLGVVETQRDGYRKEVQVSGLPIRFWWDPEREGQPVFGRVFGPRPGPILDTWDAETPNWYVIDAKGVIRYTHAFGAEVLEKAVATVLTEQGSGPDPTKKPGGQ
jgi:RNA polymerase sigma factor (sigma-70 family)